MTATASGTAETSVFNGGQPWVSRWVLADGLRTHYLEAGNGEPIVLVHGGGPGAAAEFSWPTLIPALAATHRVIALDLMGYGQSDKPADRTYSHQELSEHLASFVRTLCLPPVRLVGNSMGGYAAIKYALDAPGEVLGVFAIASGTIAYAMGLPNPKNDGRRALAEFDGSAEKLETFLGSLLREPPPGELVEARVRMFSQPDTAAAWEAMTRYNEQLKSDPNLQQVFRIADRLPRSTVPFAMMWGRDDQFAPIELARELQRLLPNAQFEFLDDCGHQCQTDQPERVHQSVLEFFDRLDRTRSAR